MLIHGFIIINTSLQRVSIMIQSINFKHEFYIVPSAAGIATRYGLDGPGIESRWGSDFPHPYRPALGPTQPPVQWVPGLSQG